MGCSRQEGRCTMQTKISVGLVGGFMSIVVALYLVLASPGAPEANVALADDPPPPVIKRVVLVEGDGALPAYPQESGTLVVNTKSSFDAAIASHGAGEEFEGTLVITDRQDIPEEWPPVSAGKTHLRATFKDLDYYNSTWIPDIAGGWEPAFVNMESSPPPTREDELLTLDLWQGEGENTYFEATLAIAKSDGSIGVRSVHSDFPENGLFGCGGPYWPFCCLSQSLSCNVFSYLLGPFGSIYCGDCDSCTANCVNCIPNPCHSCDQVGPCGLTWLLCRFFPGGNC